MPLPPPPIFDTPHPLAPHGRGTGSGMMTPYRPKAAASAPAPISAAPIVAKGTDSVGSSTRKRSRDFSQLFRPREQKTVSAPSTGILSD